MLKRLPLIPTLVVLAAVAVMIRLGFWQIDRMQEKSALLDSFAAAQANPVQISDLEANSASQFASNLYRKASFDCSKVTGWSARAGQNDRGEGGYAHIARCISAHWLRFDGPDRDADIVVGWSRSPENPEWRGGTVTGTIGPAGELGFKIVADPPLAGLQPNAKPDPNDIPNNHWSYAIQWFLFAGIALVIYGLALRKRLSA